MLFFREWIKHRKNDEYIAYDVMSISTYRKNITESEWGYNIDKEKLPQINLGMYYGESSSLPLYYRIYPGSISDKAHLKYMVSDAILCSGNGTFTDSLRCISFHLYFQYVYVNYTIQ